MGTNKKRTRPSKAQLEELYWDKRMSFRMIGDELGYSKTSIRDMFSEHGIPRRNLNQAQHVAGEEGRGRYRGGYAVLNGYRLIKMPHHHRANSRGYVMEHILVLEQKLGRQLTSEEVGHHLNGIKYDNRPENLIAMPKRKHSPKLVESALQDRIVQLERRLEQYESHIN